VSSVRHIFLILQESYDVIKVQEFVVHKEGRGEISRGMIAFSTTSSGANIFRVLQLMVPFV
jgi:hypothetical protein